MNDYMAVMMAEGVDEASEEVQIEAWQYLIEAGICHIAGR